MGCGWAVLVPGEERGHAPDDLSKYYRTIMVADTLRRANAIAGPGWSVAAGRCIWVPKVKAADQCTPPRSTRISYAEGLVNYTWTFGTKFTPKAQFNVGFGGVVFVRTWASTPLPLGTEVRTDPR